MHRRLTRSTSDKMIGGVCGGLGRYLGIDPTFVRLFFVLLAFADGGGGIIYLILWLVLPSEEQPQDADMAGTIRSSREEIARRAREVSGELAEAVRTPHPRAHLYVGGVLVLLGVVLLLRSLDITWLRWLDLGVLWPALLIVAGVALLVNHLRGE